ncbi:MAG TPA: L-seryl-tRNA(Sec) selenium transferase [Candidatus Limnocylindrales bacterium]|nr:L-seryl-tRNA(Sec) selenium transferase [Candidatus Limnocylindrales bacterium]
MRSESADTAPARPPSVERVLALVRQQSAHRDRAAVLAVAREVVDEERDRLRAAASQPGDTGDTDAPVTRTPAALADVVLTRLATFDQGTPPRTVVNATGVIVHTNLGRAPWPAAAIEAARAAAAATLFLELDPDTGRRGPRYREAEDHLVALTGAEDALVLNNNAAALAVAVGLAGRGGVAVSRGELVEIGGGVRIPEIVRRAGARLVEVGTTNRTRTADFDEVLAAGRATLVLRVHPSNFRQEGFTESPDARELATAAHAHGAIVVDDVGSGALLDTAAFGLAHEPTPAGRLADGADLVTFSGDKLVGGPQAGFVVGRADLVGRLRRDPLARAMRPDKVVLAAVAATLGLYRAGVAASEVPVWRQIAVPVEALGARADAMVAQLVPPGGLGRGTIRVVGTRATVGGGSLPGETLPSVAVGVRPGTGSATALLGRLRRGTPAVVARVEDDEVLLDLRSVEPADDAGLVEALRRALGRDG